MLASTEQRRAAYGFTPTFVPRSNVQGDYGDNQQDFWMTVTQRDWSAGEGQKFFRSNDDTSARQFFQSERIDVSTAGQVTLGVAMQDAAHAAAIITCCPRGEQSSSNIITASTSNLYEVTPTGTITDRLAHGLGTAPEKFGLCTDGTDIYLSSTDAGTVGVRKWNGAAYSTFSADGADSLLYHNNTLYGLRASDSKLVRWDTAGVKTDLHQWLQADGGVRGGTPGRMVGFGGKVYFLWSSGGPESELWQYDGSGVSLLATFGPNFYAYDMVVYLGVVYVSGAIIEPTASGGVSSRPSVYFYSSGTLGRLWKGPTGSTYASIAVTPFTPLAVYRQGIVFTDAHLEAELGGGRLMFYDAAIGGVSCIAEYDETDFGSPPYAMCASQRFLLLARGVTTTQIYPKTSAPFYPATAVVHTSIFDADSSLTKRFKSIKIDADLPTGSSVDLYYQLNDVANTNSPSSYTLIQAGAVSGTEYAIGQNARSISIRIVLNRQTASPYNQPTLKRMYLRAAPLQDTFKRREYIFDCTGRNEDSPLILRDQTAHAKDGLAMATDLNTAAVATTPFSITDRFGTFTGLMEPEGLEILEVRPEEFVVRVRVREV